MLSLRFNCRDSAVICRIKDEPKELSSGAAFETNTASRVVIGCGGDEKMATEVTFYIKSSVEEENGERDKDVETSSEERSEMKGLRKLPAWRNSKILTRKLRRM